MASTTAPDCRVASARAVGLGPYPSSRTARSTASLVARLACPDPLIARDAAERETPASGATSSSVGRRLGGVVIGSPDSGSGWVSTMLLTSAEFWKRSQFYHRLVLAID